MRVDGVEITLSKKTRFSDRTPYIYVYGRMSLELLTVPDRQREDPCQGSTLPSGMTKLTEVRVCKVDLSEHGFPAAYGHLTESVPKNKVAKRVEQGSRSNCCKLVPVFHAGPCRPCWTTQPVYGEPDSESPGRLEMETSCNGIEVRSHRRSDGRRSENILGA